MSHLAHCKVCVHTAMKWAAIAYVGHLVIHVILFLIAPWLGALGLVLF